MKLRSIVQKLPHLMKKQSSWWAVGLLILIEAFLFVSNYQPGTYLIGWDTIMPELNFPLNLSRSLVSLWQGYRGLGTVDGLSHAANLLHTLYLWILSFFLQTSDLRYVYTHLTHLLGGIGMYFLLIRILQRNASGKAQSSSQLTSSTHIIPIVSFFGSLFYLFNLGTIQMYYAPLEVFTTHFAILPWFTLQFLRTTESPSKKQYFLLFLVSFLFSQQGFVPTVFIVFLLLFGFLLLFFVLSFPRLVPRSLGDAGTQESGFSIKSRMIQGCIIASIVFAANAFWLVPFFYSSLTTPKVIQTTKINQIASDEIYYRNKAHGTIPQVLSLRGFMLSTVEYDIATRKDAYFMQRWVSHTDSLPYRLTSFLLALGMLTGIIVSLYRRERILFPFLSAAFVCFLFLANDTPGIATLNFWFRQVFPVLGEAFRIPFTKFSTLFVFCYTLFLSYGVLWLLTKFRSYRTYVLAVLLILGIYSVYPAFQGYFTSPYLRLPLPQEYLSVMKYFSQQEPYARIAILPLHTFWNWHFRSWGQRGSGFLWYGIPQPTLERAFDPWSLENEQYYTEISSAVNRRDASALQAILRKYQLGYMLVDRSILNSLSRQPINYDSLKTFLEKDSGLKKTFDQGYVTVYSTSQSPSYVSTTPLASAAQIPNEILSGRTPDLDVGTSIYYTGTTPGVIPLFANLSTEKAQADISFTTTQQSFSFVVANKLKLPPLPATATLTIPSLFATEYLVPVTITTSAQGLEFQPTYPDLALNGKTLRIPVAPLIVTPRSVKNPTEIDFLDTKHYIPFTGKAMSYLINPGVNTIRLKNGSKVETITIDTRSLNRTPLSVSLPDTTITSVSATVPIFSSPFYYPRLINRNIYQVNEINRQVPSLVGERLMKATKIQNGVTVTARAASGEVSFYLDNLFHQASYLIYSTTSYTSGLPMNVYVDNPYQKRAELDTVLSRTQEKNVLLLPKTEDFYSGYGFHFIVKSVGNEVATSTLHDVGVYPFPLETLSRIAITTTNGSTVVKSSPVPFQQLTRSQILTTVPPLSLLTLSESFHPGWRAYTFTTDRVSWYQQLLPFVFGKALTDHTRVTNWANGWIVTEAGSVIMVFLPQYLGYLGLGVTLGTLGGLLIAIIKEVR